MPTMAPERGSINNNNGGVGGGGGGRTLHNFSLPPKLSWGTQKLLRCSNSTSSLTAAAGGGGFSPPQKRRRNTPERGEGEAVPEVRTWNLRTRRGVEVDETAAAAVVVVTPRVKFSVSLLRSEIEDDFVAILGRRPPRKPKKRPRYIQKQLDTVFPGLWLSEITADMYKVNETPELPITK